MVEERKADELFDDLDALLGQAFGASEAAVRAPEELRGAGRRYEVEEEIGRGGQGVVYRARDHRLGRMVALKVLTGLHGSSASRLARFQREARVASRLNHPGICSVFDHGTRHGLPFITMPLLAGESLAAKIARARWEDREVLVPQWPASAATDAAEHSDEGRATASVVRLLEKAALALHAAHEAGVVHRDVKPDNIMVTPEGDPVLLDFGLAQDAEDETPRVTLSGEVFGTPAYMAPEQLEPAIGPVDRRTDVYALGAVLFESLTLERPFEDAASRQPVRREVPPPDPRRLRSAIPRDLSLTIRTALDPEPARRYPTALAFAEDLRRCLAREPIRARPASLSLRVRRWAQRNPRLTAAGLALFAGLALALQFLAEARRAQDDADRHLAEWQVLADAGRVAELRREAEQDLWPAVPEKAEAMRDWLARARRLTARLPEHRRILSGLKARALPYDAAARRRDRESQVERLVLAETMDEQIREARALLAGDALTADRRRHLEKGLEEQRARRAELEELLSRRATWSFADATDRWRHRQQRRLLESIEALDAEDPHGPTIVGVEARLAIATSVVRRTVEEQTEAWARTREQVAADPRFAGLRLSPQVGLVPLGPDPTTGLQEFALPQTGSVPERDEASSTLRLEEKSALVLVLVPGGEGWMGAQASDPQEPHYLPSARPTYGPVHEVRLAPFLMSKYEMTQGQWMRITGGNPSATRAGRQYAQRAATLLDPVEMVTWDACREALRRIGCRLPTEAQWEYACRAGTRSTWFTGDSESSLQGFANLADATGARYWGRERRRLVEGLDDGFMDHAPVGSFRPNPWGLHDMHGNVWEICRDASSYELPAQGPDGRRASRISGTHHVARGGSFTSPGPHAASATRNLHRREYCFYDVGVRPVRMLVAR